MSERDKKAQRKRIGIGGHHSPRMGTDEWLTPPWILEALGRFDLDPCAPINPPWRTAGHHYTIEDNGLQLPWFGRVWCNPPYGRDTSLWLKKMASHNEGVALLFARTETRMFFDYVWDRATALLFIKGRLHFHDVNGQRAQTNSGAPSVLVAYGTECMLRLMASGINGKFLKNSL